MYQPTIDGSFDSIGQSYNEFMKTFQSEENPFMALFNGSPMMTQLRSLDTMNMLPNSVTNGTEIKKNLPDFLKPTKIESSGADRYKKLTENLANLMEERKKMDHEIRDHNMSYDISNIVGIEKHLATGTDFKLFETEYPATTKPKIEIEPIQIKPLEISQPEIIQEKEIKNSEEKILNLWPELSIDDINTSLKVVINLQPGYKLKIVGEKYLAPDDSYFYMMRYYVNGGSRDTIISFLDHMTEHTKNHLQKLIREIKTDFKNENNYNNIGILNDLVQNLSTFMHNYEKIKEVYKKDTTCCARLDNIYKKFVNLHTVIICDMTKKN